MTLTPTERRKSEVKNMNIVVEESCKESDKEKRYSTQESNLVIKNSVAEANGSSPVHDDSKSINDSISLQHANDESAL
jgi:hypothetical protein